ncbi:MAG: nucleoside triphosphate pyrophosphohydrolase [Spirochaetota bacterium]
MKFKEDRPLYMLMELAAILRNKCPWDREQTFKSLKPYLIEEAYEAYEAIETGDIEHMKEEFGDLLYQVYAHSEIANEEKSFNIDDVAQGIIEKLIRRHPHVFGEDIVKDKHDVIKNWEIIKKKEKSHRESILDGVPKQLPALLKAYRIQQKTSRVGFDWEKSEDIVKKLDEEINEFKEVVNANDREKIKEEAGDILFTIVNILRHIDVNPEEALSSSTQKFMNRFRYIEQESAKENKNINEMSIEELDALWEKAKKSLS